MPVADYTQLIEYFLGHKGKWIGIGTFLMGLGSFVCTLPHYLSNPYHIEQLNETASDYGQCVYRSVINVKNMELTIPFSVFSHKFIFLLTDMFIGPLFCNFEI